jgi:hypothetical protein
LKARARSAANLLILVPALVLSVVLAELALRILHPVYEYAADYQYDPSRTRIWRNHPGSLEQRRHPDTGSSHWLIHNNLGSHQHRDFSEEQLADAVNVAFFGDSFTENRRLPSTHTFSELLDYLLNLHDQRFNVLNFGVDGYGTDQSYLTYDELRESILIDWVFYLAVDNDLDNIRLNGLFALDASGEVVQKAARSIPWHIRIVSRLHLTYLLYEIRGLLDPSRRGLASNRALLYEEYLYSGFKKRFRDDQETPIESRDLPRAKGDTASESARLMWYLLEVWQDAADSSGARFVVAGIPRFQEHELLTVVSRKHATLDLFEQFRGQVADYDYRDMSFENDPHWDERGNMLAAILICRYLEDTLGLEWIREVELKQAMSNYYAAFGDSWRPGADFPPANADPVILREIRARYTALEPEF